LTHAARRGEAFRPSVRRLPFAGHRNKVHLYGEDNASIERSIVIDGRGQVSSGRRFAPALDFAICQENQQGAGPRKAQSEENIVRASGSTSKQ